MFLNEIVKVSSSTNQTLFQLLFEENFIFFTSLLAEFGSFQSITFGGLFHGNVMIGIWLVLRQRLLEICKATADFALFSGFGWHRRGTL